jgi:hypothetical protein
MVSDAINALAASGLTNDMLIDKRERFIFGYPATNQSERDEVLPQSLT